MNLNLNSTFEGLNLLLERNHQNVFTKRKAQDGIRTVSITLVRSLTSQAPHSCRFSLGKSGLKISKVILGAMSYGSSDWQSWVLNEAEALPLLKHAYDVGINTWDTADIYSNGRSEEIIGKAIKEYNIPRSKLVILSKCYFGVNEDGSQPSIGSARTNDGEYVNQVGLSRKHIFDAVERSVKRLGTYIDVLQIHRLDREASREEIMRALNDVVEKGWVRYIGASSVCAASVYGEFT